MISTRTLPGSILWVLALENCILVSLFTRFPLWIDFVHSSFVQVFYRCWHRYMLRNGPTGEMFLIGPWSGGGLAKLRRTCAQNFS